MELNRAIIEILSYLPSGNKNSFASLQVMLDHVTILSGKTSLVRINQDSILLFEGQDIQERIAVKNSPSHNTVPLPKVKTFLETISTSIIRLNHVGISYSCKEFQDELETYTKIIPSPFTLSREEAHSERDRWYFIGDLRDWKSPLFEVVLTTNRKSPVDKWIPHFQIDIDTTLGAEELQRRLKDTLGSGFDWTLDIPSEGVVLGMKILGSINGTKICLGLGTDKRDTKYHRQHLLQ